MYSAGVSVENAMNFVNQPIIREVTKYASDNALSIGKFKNAIDFVAAKYGVKINAKTKVTPMY